MMKLRALEPEDLELLYTIENSPEMWDVSGFSATPYSRYALRRYIEDCCRDLSQAGEMRFVIENDGKGVGLIDLVNYSARDSRAEVSVAILREFRGKGLAHEAIKKLEELSRSQYRIRMLYAMVGEEENSPVRKVFEESGFLPTAVLKEWHFRAGKYENVHVFQKNLQIS